MLSNQSEPWNKNKLIGQKAPLRLLVRKKQTEAPEDAGCFIGIEVPGPGHSDFFNGPKLARTANCLRQSRDTIAIGS